MSETLTATVDKFTFRVPTDRSYTDEGLWVLWEEGGRIARVGLGDFLQQSSGDVAFAEMKPVGTVLAAGDAVATIETIKVAIELISPVAGKIVEVNRATRMAPEVINEDPYGRGWLVRLEVSDPKATVSRLLDPPAYFARMKGEAEEAARKP